MAHSLRTWLALGLALLCPLVLASHCPTRDGEIRAVRVASGLVIPVFATAPVGDPRLFIVERGGAIRILRDGVIAESPFLDLSALLPTDLTPFDERGLLGLAFAPDYATSGLFYVFYYSADDEMVLARYEVGDDPDRANDPDPDRVLVVPQPWANHNGGHIEFGPDGMLYVGLGDGGGGGDPLDSGQDGSTLLGKLLRIDVGGGAGSGYRIPADNPFVDSDELDEIWALGLRNPYRFHIDPFLQILTIGDVGQGSFEELDLELLAAGGGRNYGWRRMEGEACFNPGSACNDGSLSLPLLDYDHGGGRCSIVDGPTYWGSLPQILGRHFFADFCSGQVWTVVAEGVGFDARVVELRDRTDELDPFPTSLGLITGFGMDGMREIYLLDFDGDVFKIVGAETVDTPR